VKLENFGVRQVGHQLSEQSYQPDLLFITILTEGSMVVELSMPKFLDATTNAAGGNYYC
jgi:hypothetical protein